MTEIKWFISTSYELDKCGFHVHTFYNHLHKLPNFFPSLLLGFHIFQHDVNSLTSKSVVKSVPHGSNAEPMPQVSLLASTRYSYLCVMSIPEVSVLCLVHIPESKLSIKHFFKTRSM